jgi:pimeloyl-ACP methyl ester carboxylesterase
MKPQIFCIRFLQFVFVSLFVVSCIKPEENIPTPENQYLISAQKITDVSLAEIQQRAGLLAGLAKNEVSAFKLTYNTVNLDQSPIVASGLVLFPNDLDSLSLLAFQHGTILTQEEAPSSYQAAGNMEAYLAGTLGASLEKGYMVVMADYLGFGETKNMLHPYQHRASLASASLDMLRAAKEFAATMDQPLRKGVVLAGYSEGGYASMALHQAIEEAASSEFTVTSTLAGAGAYDMVSTAKWVVSQNRNLPDKASTFYTWVLLTFNEMYGINMPLTEMLTPANAEKVGQALLAGNPLTAEISDNPSELFTPQFIQGITQETNTAFIQALRDNNVHDWNPKAPVMLFHAPGDDIVPALNSVIAEQAIKARGGSATLVPLGNENTSHRNGIQLYLAYVLNALQ